MKPRNISLSFAVLSIIVAGVFISGCGTTRPIGSLTLRYNLKQGQVIKQRMIISQNIEQHLTMSGTVMTQKVAQVFGFGFEQNVLDIDTESNYIIDYSFSWVKWGVDNPTISLEYDSDNPPATINPATIGLAAFKGVHYKSKMSPSGKLLTLYEPQASFNQLVSNIYSYGNEVSQETLDTIIKSLNADDFLPDNNQEITFPLYPLKIGDSWTQTNLIEKLSPMMIINRYTLTNRINGRAILKIDSVIFPHPTISKPIKSGGMSMQLNNLNGMQTGFSIVNESTGLAVSNVIYQTIFSEVEMLSGMIAGMKWPQKISSTNVFYEVD